MLNIRPIRFHYMCCIVKENRTVGNFHMSIPGGASIRESIQRNCISYVEASKGDIAQLYPFKAVLIPVESDIKTVGAEVNVTIFDFPEPTK